MKKFLPMPLTVLLLLAALVSVAQINPFMKKYAGPYYLLNFGEETPTAASEKINFTMDGKWSSVSFPVDDNGTPSKVPVKKAGTWKASDGLIQVTTAGSPGPTDFKWSDGMFMSADKYLQKIFVTNPVFLAKYAGSFKVLGNSEEHPTEFSETVTLKPDGKCSRSTPAVDDAGQVTKNPVVVAGTWKANDGVIQITFPEEGQDRMTEFTLNNGVFTDRGGNYLQKSLPPAPAVNYLPKYAGVYNMLADGEPATAKSDKYVLTADGKGTWTYFNESGVPVTVKGTWKASEGLIQIYFSPGDSGGKGDELLTDFRLKDGVFRAEGVVLKKVVTK
ncbi:MAG TPA: hypothetical protein PK059_06035 [Cyclobacteriaceae bacterium]|nr:hypothetical protein [Cyclobacteriaceae bacterium]